MGNNGQDPELSESGNPILRHDEKAEFHPVGGGGGATEQISKHISRHLGEVENVLHELVSDTVHIDIHVVKPTSDFPFYRLVTSGMSDLPMSVPEEVEAPRFAELMVTVPAGWKLDEESLNNEEWYWPIRQLKFLARLPHKHATWLGWGHTIPNGDPPEQYSPGTELAGAIILPSVTVPDEFHVLEVSPEKAIQFFAVIPLYPEEMDLKLKSGSDRLLDKLGRANVSDVVEPTRKNVGKKRFGFF